MIDARASESEKLRQEFTAILNQLGAYFQRTLDERSFTELLSNLTHLRTRLESVEEIPQDFSAALALARKGLRQALERLTG